MISVHVEGTPAVANVPSSALDSPPDGPSIAGSSILGIWRLGKTLYRSETAELSIAQPADAAGSPRWDYVIKCAVGEEDDYEARHQINRFTAAATAVSHPNLVAILDASVSGASPYVVMPRVEGRTMQQHFDRFDVKPLPVALWLVRQVAQALEALHGAGWIHGDVKPANVIIGARGHVTLIDLSFAARVHTPLGMLFRGTPAYAAPELVAGNTAALPAMDLFALGRMLWQWLTRIEPVSEQQLEPVASLVEQMVAENPDERPDAETVRRRLLQLEIETLGWRIGPGRERRRAA